MTNLSSKLAAARTTATELTTTTTNQDPWFGYCGRVFVAIMILLGMIFSVMAISSCDFFTMSIGADADNLLAIEGTAVQNTFVGRQPIHQYLFESEYGFIEPPFELHIGLFRHTVTKFGNSGSSSFDGSDCRNYDASFVHENLPEQWFALSRFFAITAPLIALLGGIVCLLEVCCVDIGNKTSRSILCGVFIVAFISQCMTFSMFQEDSFCDDELIDECSLANGAKFSIFACVFYVAAALCIIILPRPKPYLDTVLGTRNIGNEQKVTNYCYKRISSKPILPEEETVKSINNEGFDDEKCRHIQPSSKEAVAVSVASTSSEDKNSNNEQVPLVLTAPMTYDSDDDYDDDDIEVAKGRAAIEANDTQAIMRSKELEFHTDIDESRMNQLYKDPLMSNGDTSHMGEDSDDDIENPKEEESPQQQFSIDMNGFMVLNKSGDRDNKCGLSKLEQASVSRHTDGSRTGSRVSANLDDDDVVSEASIEISLEQAASIAEGEASSLLPPMEADSMEPEPLLYLPLKDDSAKPKSESESQISDNSSKAQAKGKSKSNGFWSLWWKGEDPSQNSTNDGEVKNSKNDIASKTEKHNNGTINENRVALFVDSTMVGMVDHGSSQLSKEKDVQEDISAVDKETLPAAFSKNVEEDMADRENGVALFIDSSIVGIVDHKPTQSIQKLSDDASGNDTDIREIDPEDGDTAAATVWPVVEPTSQTHNTSSEQNEGTVSSPDVLILHALPEQDEESSSAVIPPKLPAEQPIATISSADVLIRHTIPKEDEESTNAVTQQCCGGNTNTEVSASSTTVLDEALIAHSDDSVSSTHDVVEDEEDEVSICSSTASANLKTNDCAKVGQDSIRIRNDEVNDESTAMPVVEESARENSKQLSDSSDTQEESNHDLTNWPVFTEIPKENEVVATESEDGDASNESSVVATKRNMETAIQSGDADTALYRPKKKRFRLPWRSSKTSKVEALSFDSANKIDTATAISAELKPTNSLATGTIDQESDISNLANDVTETKGETTPLSMPASLMEELGNGDDLETVRQDQDGVSPSNPDTKVGDSAEQSSHSAKLTISDEKDNLSAPSDEMDSDDNATISTNQSSSEEEVDQVGPIIQDVIGIAQDACIDDLCGGEQKEQSGCESKPGTLTKDAVSTEPLEELTPENTDPATETIEDELTAVDKGEVNTHLHSVSMNQDKNDAEVLSVATISTDDSTAHGSPGMGSPESKDTDDPDTPGIDHFVEKISDDEAAPQKTTSLDEVRVDSLSTTEPVHGCATS